MCVRVRVCYIMLGSYTTYFIKQLMLCACVLEYVSVCFVIIRRSPVYRSLFGRTVGWSVGWSIKFERNQCRREAKATSKIIHTTQQQQTIGKRNFGNNQQISKNRTELSLDLHAISPPHLLKIILNWCGFRFNLR